MKEINKFSYRVWEIGNPFEQGCVSSEHNTKLWVTTSGELEGTCYFSLNYEPVNTSSLEIERFVNLIDIKGNPIYVGDIIEFTPDASFKKRDLKTRVVGVIEDLGYKFQVRAKNKIFNIEDIVFRSKEKGPMECLDARVIGNKHVDFSVYDLILK